MSIHGTQGATLPRRWLAVAAVQKKVPLSPIGTHGQKLIDLVGARKPADRRKTVTSVFTKRKMLANVHVIRQ